MFIRQKTKENDLGIEAFRLDDTRSGKMSAAYGNGTIAQDENNASLFHINDGIVQYDVHADEALVYFDRNGINVIDASNASKYVLCTEDGTSIAPMTDTLLIMQEPLKYSMSELKDAVKSAFEQSIMEYPRISMDSEQIISYLEVKAPHIIRAAMSEMGYTDDKGYSGNNIRKNIEIAATQKIELIIKDDRAQIGEIGYSPLLPDSNAAVYGASSIMSEANIQATKTVTDALGAGIESRGLQVVYSPQPDFMAMLAEQMQISLEGKSNYDASSVQNDRNGMDLDAFINGTASVQATEQPDYTSSQEFDGREFD